MTFFVETNILNIHLFTILNLSLCCVNMNWSHRKWHNSVIMSPSDLRQVSKFSLVRYLKLFLWHPKDLVCRKNVLGEEKISSFHCKLFTMAWVKKNGSHRKWHNSVIMSPSDLGQVSKFSLVPSLKLFLWHPKNLVIRKNVTF